MKLAWQQHVPISEYVEESETARKISLYATTSSTTTDKKKEANKNKQKTNKKKEEEEEEESCSKGIVWLFRSLIAKLFHIPNLKFLVICSIERIHLGSENRLKRFLNT